MHKPEHVSILKKLATQLSGFRVHAEVTSELINQEPCSRDFKIVTTGTITN